MSAVEQLKGKQRAFVEAYLGPARWNATRAARMAGYSERTAFSIGWENLRKPEIAAAVSERLAESAMAADEVLARLGDQARGTMEDFLDEEGRIDIEQARQLGKLHLIKEYAVDQERRGGEECWEVQKVKLKLHDAQAALVQIGRHHGLFTDKVELGGAGGGPVRIGLKWEDGNSSEPES